jgi:hypothetical protein
LGNDFANRKNTMKTIAILALAAGIASGQSNDKMSPEQAREENAYAVGVQAYLWGYPLRFYGGMVPGAIKVGGSYVNEFRKFTDLKTAKDRFVVTPNNVTIDGYSNFDVTNEPLVVFVPKLSAPRWYIVQIGDSFDEIIHNIGGIKGEQPGVYVITGLQWQHSRRNGTDQEPHPAGSACTARVREWYGGFAEGARGAKRLSGDAPVGLFALWARV